LKALDQRKFVLAPHCDDDKKDENGKNCEDIVKDRSGEKKVEKKKKKTVEKKEVEKKEDDKQDDITEPLSGAAKSFCIPFDQPEVTNLKCFQCGNPAKHWTLWGRSY